MVHLLGSKGTFVVLPFLCWPEGNGDERPEMNQQQPGWVREL